MIDVHFEAWQPAARQVAFRYDLESAKRRAPHHADRRRQLRAAGQQGDAHPDPRRGQADQARRCPCAASAPRRPRRRPISPSTRAARSRCSSTRRAPSPSTTACAWCWRPSCSAKGKRRVTLTLTFPDDVAFYAAQADLDKFSRTLAGPDWFAFQPSKEVVPGVIDMDRWLDGPAGKHGGVRMVKDALRLRGRHAGQVLGREPVLHRQRPGQGDGRLHRRPLRQVRHQRRAHAQVLLPHRPDAASATRTTPRAWTPRGSTSSTTSPPS